MNTPRSSPCAREEEEEEGKEKEKRAFASGFEPRTRRGAASAPQRKKSARRARRDRYARASSASARSVTGTNRAHDSVSGTAVVGSASAFFSARSSSAPREKPSPRTRSRAAASVSLKKRSSSRRVFFSTKTRSPRRARLRVPFLSGSRRSSSTRRRCATVATRRLLNRSSHARAWFASVSSEEASFASSSESRSKSYSANTRGSRAAPSDAAANDARRVSGGKPTSSSSDESSEESSEESFSSRESSEEETSPHTREIEIVALDPVLRGRRRDTDEGVSRGGDDRRTPTRAAVSTLLRAAKSVCSSSPSPSPSAPRAAVKGTRHTPQRDARRAARLCVFFGRAAKVASTSLFGFGT